MISVFIDGVSHDFIPLKDFRAQFGLPETFSISWFQPKDFTGLGSIRHANSELMHVRQALLETLPDGMPPAGWSSLSVSLQMAFRHLLFEVNPQIGLKPEEIDYAVNGLGQVCYLLMQHCTSARMRGQPLPSFNDIHHLWLEGSVIVWPKTYGYEWDDNVWGVQVIEYAYGRIGMAVSTPQGIFAVLDRIYTCPAEGFMTLLLRDIVERILDLMQQAAAPQ